MPNYDMNSEFSKRKLDEFLATAKDRGWSIKVDKVRTPRSLSQNRYYFALLALYGAELGYTSDELHVDMKRVYGLVYEKNGRKYLKSTSALNTKEMTDYIEYIRNHASKENGIYLPSADEMTTNWAEIQNYIDQQKQHTGDQR